MHGIGKWLTTVTLTIACFSLYAQQSKDDGTIAKEFQAMANPCGDSQNQMEMNQCAGEQYQRLDDRMNELYKEQMAALGPVSRSALRDAQRAWIIFRDKSCAYEAGRDPRSYMQLIELECLQRFTTERVRDLQAYLACTSNGCPSG